MEMIATKLVSYLDTDKTMWNDIERLQMILGMQVLLHNIIMMGTLLIIARLTGMFPEAVILLAAYGVLKIAAGGIHFKRSFACLLATETFVTSGILISRHLHMRLAHIILIYIVCLAILAVIGPQGTENNPISEENFGKLKRMAIWIISVYLILTIVMAIYMKHIPYLLFIAVVFETLSLLPSYPKNRRH